MELINYRNRVIDNKLKLYLETFGAVLVEGPKWCGKTWTSLNQSKSQIFLSDPQGNFNNKRLAMMNPDLVLVGDSPRLIDEWQEVPQIWDAVRSKVDFSTQKGVFILTGSATVNKSSYIHTGTGRIARIRMRPMSLYESGKSNGLVSLKDICNNQMKDVFTNEVNLTDIIDYILVGGWPSSMNINKENGILVSREYSKSIINEDIYKVDNVKRDKRKIELLLRSLARNEATTVTNMTLKKDIKDKDFDDINIDTISNYLNMLNSLYILENIEPYSNNIRSSLRIKQSEKRHFVDPSLPSAPFSEE